MTSRLLVFDPGRTTGWARFEDGQLSAWGELILWRGIDKMIRHGDTVAYERIQALHPSFDSIGIQVIGVICYLCEQQQIEPRGVHPGSLTGPQHWPGHEELRKLLSSEHAYDAVLHGAVLLKSRGLRDLLDSVKTSQI